jgi:hypothetical protein
MIRVPFELSDRERAVLCTALIRFADHLKDREDDSHEISVKEIHNLLERLESEEA